MRIVEPINVEVKKALYMSPEEAQEIIKALQDQLEMGIREPQIVIEWDD